MNGALRFDVPDQILNVPVLDLKCGKKSEVSEVFWANSLEQLYSNKNSWARGFSQSVKLTAEIEVPEVATASAETTVTASLMGGGSKSTDKANKVVNEGHTLSSTI